MLMLVKTKLTPNNKQKMISVLLIDDEAHWLEEVDDYIRFSKSNVRIVAQSDDPYKTQELIKRFKPDVLVVDYCMPGLNGLEVAQRVQESSTLPTVILSAKLCEMIDFEKFNNCSFVDKSQISKSLLSAINNAYNGSKYMSDHTENVLLKAKNNTLSEIGDLWSKLTPTEKAISFHLVEGYCPKKIAEKIGVDTQTIRWHIKNLKTKLGCKDLYQLLRILHKVKKY